MSAGSFTVGQVMAQCPTGETELVISIATDQYGAETTWQLTGSTGTPIYASGGPYTNASSSGAQVKPDVTTCVPNGTVVKFTAFDQYGDGMNGGYGVGYWKVKYNGTVLGQGGSFGASETRSFAIGATDMALDAVQVGYNYILQEDHTVSGTVSNTSTLPISAFSLTYTVDGSNPVTEDFTASVPVGGSYDYSFTTPWNAPLGVHTVAVSVASVTGGDLIASNNSGTRKEHVAEQLTDRTTLMEEFTSSTCGPCYSLNVLQGFDATLASVQTNQPGSRVAAIKYQMNWPSPSNDPSYNSDGSTRRGYYGVTGIPDPFLDAKEMSYASTAEINAGKDEPSPLDLQVSYTLSGTDIVVTATATPLASTLTGNYKLHLAVTEDHYHYQGAATPQKDYHFAMRKMLPNGQGNTLTALTMGQAQTVTQSYSLVEGGPVQGNFNLWGDVDGITIVAFVQNTSTKEILQSAVAAEPFVGIGEHTANNMLRVWPNPTNDVVFLRYAHPLAAGATVEVFDMLGERVLNTQRSFSGADQVEAISLEKLPAGMYMVRLIANGTSSTQRINLVR